MTDRLTIDQITSDDLDQMYAEIDQLRAREERATIYQAAWHSARHRARLMSEELTRRAPLTGQYAAALARIQALADEHPAGIDTALVLEALDQTSPAPATVEAGPTVREAAHADRRWPLEKHGE